MAITSTTGRHLEFDTVDVLANKPCGESLMAGLKLIKGFCGMMGLCLIVECTDDQLYS